MIFVEIGKDGIERVSVRAACEAEQDRDLQLWPLVRRGLNRLNRDIERQLRMAQVKLIHGNHETEPKPAA
ncbi:MAG TPA: hypothetical protein VGA01_06905 [Candidatus Binatia bacterium]|nr:hypothetical protein [Verrucomicrobiae bacterium]